MQVAVSEEDHVIDHEAEKGTQLVLGRQHELLRLILNYGVHLSFDLPCLFQHEVSPWELLFHLIVQWAVSGLIGVCVENLNGEPTGRVEFDHLQWVAVRCHCHPPSHQLQLLALFLAEQVKVHGAQKLLQLERPVL